MTEKSCGTVLYTIKNDVVHYLLIQIKGGWNCGFPKGHMENNETEEETAVRETWEETSIKAEIIPDFRREIKYKMYGGIEKTVVYFLARYDCQMPKHNDGFENLNYLLLPFDKAYKMLTFDNTKVILKAADEYIKKHNL